MKIRNKERPHEIKEVYCKIKWNTDVADYLYLTKCSSGGAGGLTHNDEILWIHPELDKGSRNLGQNYLWRPSVYWEEFEYNSNEDALSLLEAD